MYATVRRYEGVQNPAEAVRLVSENFVPIISKIPGFVAYYWIDAGGGVLVSTSVFQDKAGAEHSNTIAAKWAQENLVGYFTSQPQITMGEVVAYET